jgi:hypothetical protein
MAEAMEGIMGLPQSQGSAELMQAASDPLLQSYAKGNPKQFNRDLNAALGEADPQLMATIRAELADVELPQEIIDSIQMVIDRLMNEPERYAEIRQQLLTEDFPEDLLPETFDAEFFQALYMVLEEIENQNRAMGREPMRMADGGLASLGRSGDTMLAHINPQEAALLKAVGGSGTINPYTGLPEFGFFSSITKPFKKAFKSVKKAVKSVLKSPIGRIVATIGLSMVLGPAVAGFTGLSAGPVLTGITAGLSSTAVGLASGQSFKDALKGGVITGLTAGVGDYALGKLTGPAVEGGAPVYDANGQLVAPSGTPVTQGLQPVQAGGNAINVASSPSTLSDMANIDLMSNTNMAMTPETAFSSATSGAAPASMADVMAASSPGISADMTAGLTGGGVSPAVSSGFSFGPTSAPMADFSTAGTGINNFSNLSNMADLSGAAPGIAGLSQPSLAGLDVTSPLNAANAAPAPQTYISSPTENTLMSSFNDGLQSTKDFMQPVTDKVEGVWDQYISPNRPGYGEGFDQVAKAQEIYAGSLDPTTGQYGMTFQDAYKAAAPGIMSTIGAYAPMAALAGAGLYAGGAFDEPPPPEVPEWATVTGEDLLAQDPEKYGLRFGGFETSYSDLINSGRYSGYGQGYNPYARMGYQAPTYAANGGEMQSFPRKNGHISGPGTGTSDDVPAMLSDGEFVFTANAVRGMGNGSRRQGAKKMYALMKALEGRGVA